jgi:signal transduction histidine kinase
MSVPTNAKNESPITTGRWLRLNLVLLGLVSVISLSFPISTLSQKLNDFYFKLRRPSPASSHVALVLIDDGALARYGRWPWQRRLLAELIRSVSKEQPAAVGIDILLSEPEDLENDSELERAIHDAPNVVLASKISGSPQNGLWVDPIPLFLQASKGTGHVQAITDSDGLCRSIPLQEPSLEGPRAAFALKLAGLLQPQLEELKPLSDSSGSGIARISTRPLLIDFRRQIAPGQENPSFITVSAADVLAGKSGARLRGKAVVIGFGGSELSDRLFTPVSNQIPMPGAEINANVLDMLLTGRSLTRVPMPAQLVIIALVSSISLWLVVRYPGLRGLCAVSAILVFGYFAGYLVFLRFHCLLAYAPVLVAGVFAAPIAQLENLLIVDREVTSRLQHLRSAVRLGSARERFGGRAAVLDWNAPSRLHWKLAALKELQDELGSLYNFHKTLLETMREAMAVYDADGGLRFSNTIWTELCQKHGIALEHLKEITQLTGGWSELAELSQKGDAWTEREATLGAECWLFRAVGLPWTSMAATGAVLMIAEDITATRQRDEARSEALSFVTHELRTPLISIQGFSELLMRYPNSPASREAAPTIFRETNRLVAMINTYLEVLRLDAGARPLRRTEVDVGSMVNHVEKVLRPLATSARVPIRVQIIGGDTHLLCDEALVSGALLNLLSNAIKYGEHGTEVLLRVTCAASEIEFEVHNSGPAIPADELDHLFERFYRPSRSESIPGWGLGLNFVRRICQQHGGSVQLNSDAVAGTSFAFTLPRGAYRGAEVAR